MIKNITQKRKGKITYPTSTWGRKEHLRLLLYKKIITNWLLKKRIKDAHGNQNCKHPGSFGNICFVCGKKPEETGVLLRYIHKGLRLNQDEINRMCESDTRIMESQRKLYLVLDLDHTLLNSTRINDMTTDEKDYLKTLTQTTVFFSSRSNLWE